MEASLTLKREVNISLRGIHILKDSISLHEIHNKSEKLLIWFRVCLGSVYFTETKNFLLNVL